MIVVQIDGVPDLITSGPLLKRVRYGDAGLRYGDPGLIYGGLTPVTNFKSLLSLDSSMTISQKIEPEQGRGSVSMLTLSFTDKDGYFSKLISPGVIVDEPMGNKFVKIYLGYQNTSFPEDFLISMRGFISGTTYGAGKVSIQISDPNIKRRAQICFTPKTKLTSPINSSTLSIPVVKTDGFYDHVLGPDLTYDTTIKTYLTIDDEVMEYGPGALLGTSVNVSSRGARSTSSASHSAGATVENSLQVQGNLVDLALKFMLSGFNGPYKSGVSCRSIVNTLDPSLGNISNAVLLPENVDAILDLGLTIGDYMTVSGSSFGNDKTVVVIDILPALTRQNRLILCDQDFTVESPATGVSLAFRSRYDTFPVICGAKMAPYEVDVTTHVSVRNLYLAQNENRMRFYIKEPFALKSFIETELFLPVSAYSITRYGQVSIALTKPPIADQKFITISKDNVLDPQNVLVTRSINNRRYFNEVQYTFDFDDSGNDQSTESFLDTESLSKVSISTPLPITSKGLRTDLGAESFIKRRGKFLLRRYKDAAFELNYKVNWATASQLEVGDVVLVKDEGNLHIINFADGTRNIDTALFEVIQRQLDIKSGQGNITLLSSLGVEVTDRFATISPSSLVVAGSTTTAIKIKDSFGAIFPRNEKKKWVPYIGLPIFVHSPDYSNISNEVTLTGFDPADNYKMLVDPPLSYTPAVDDIVEIGKYDTGSDPNVNKLYKIVHAYLDPSVTVVSGIDDFNFFVSPSDATLFNLTGLAGVILIHNTDYSIMSPEVKLTAIDTGTGQITTSSSLGFTPAAGQKVELIGFKDGGGAYRFI